MVKKLFFLFFASALFAQGAFHDWPFISDHLPVGIEIDGLKIITWNILNSKFMHNIQAGHSKNLAGSAITQNHHSFENNLFERERIILKILEDLIQKCDLLAIQEMDPLRLLPILKKRCPYIYYIHRPDSFDCDLIIYNPKTFTPLSQTITYSETSPQTFIDITLDHNGKAYQFVTTRLNGKPDWIVKSREEFKQYLSEALDPTNHATIALGDMNSIPEMGPLATDHINYTSYLTHPCVDDIPKQYDHIWVKAGTSVEPLPPAFFGPAVLNAAQYLNLAIANKF